MDQNLVHLSPNHTSLPRVHKFLVGLRAGHAATVLTAGKNIKLSAYGSKQASNSENEVRTRRSAFFNLFNPITRQSVSMHDDAHDSQTRWRLQPNPGSISTYTTGGDAQSTLSAENTTNYDETSTNESDALGTANEAEVRQSGCPPPGSILSQEGVVVENHPVLGS